VKPLAKGPVNRETGIDPGHVLALDGVRGLAILAVLAIHLLQSNDRSSSLILQTLLSIRGLLWSGVTLFFSLSGYLITGILFDTLGSEGYFRTFFARRALRIFPLYYGVLLMLLLLTSPLHFEWHGQAYRLLTYTTNLPFVPEWNANPAPYINLRQFWSLAVEEQFYLIWPFLIFWLKSWRKILTAALAGAAFSLAFRAALATCGFPPQNHTLPGCMDALLLGGALALLTRSTLREQVLRLGQPVFLGAVAITLFEAITHPGLSWGTSTYLTTIGMTIVALGATGLVAASLRAGSIAQAVCRTAPLRFFGRYSYGLYVYHYSVSAALDDPTRAALLSRGFSKPWAILAAASAVLLVSVGLSVISYNLYEKHFLRLKRFVPNRQPVSAHSSRR
jgi:peptidoglycan/LPS O-acetylase OafA/YrhL